MKTLTQQELVNTVKAIKGATFVTIETETLPKVIKGASPLVKRSRVNGVINFIYENSVNKQREREGSEKDFEAAPRTWGEHETAAIVTHKDKNYLQLKVEKSQEPEYFSGGERLQKAVAEQILYQSKSSSRQGVEKEVIVRTYKIESIRKITINGETYDVV